MPASPYDPIGSALKDSFSKGTLILYQPCILKLASVARFKPFLRVQAKVAAFLAFSLWLHSNFVALFLQYSITLHSC
jgi:hypothetical protein